MKKLVLSIITVLILQAVSSGQSGDVQINGKEVFKNTEVVFHQIDEHTWVGTGNRVYNESLYLIEGNSKSVLIDAGTRIRNLDKILASLTSKPVMLVLTHVHGDHTGSIDDFPEIYINPADTILIKQTVPNYKGKIKYLKDGEIIDLGGRKLDVIFTPAHTPGSTTLIDRAAGYGFSGDSFGSGNLLLTLTFSTLISTCEKTGAIMDKYGIKFLYPGHFSGNNLETRKRVADMITLSKDVLSGKVKGKDNPTGMMGLNLLVSDYGVRINYTSKAVK